MKKVTLYMVCLGVLSSCVSPSPDSAISIVDDRKPVVRKIELKEYGTKMMFGEPVKDDLEYHYIETFDEMGYLHQSITVFGYDATLDSNRFLFDTLTYTYQINDDHVEYFIDGELSEIEIRNKHRMTVYDVENPQIPMIIRKYDTHGNMIMDIAIDGEELFLRDYELIQKDSLGYAKEALAWWSSYELPTEFDFEKLELEVLEKVDSAVFLVDFQYLIE